MTLKLSPRWAQFHQRPAQTSNSNSFRFETHKLDWPVRFIASTCACQLTSHRRIWFKTQLRGSINFSSLSASLFITLWCEHRPTGLANLSPLPGRAKASSARSLGRRLRNALVAASRPSNINKRNGQNCSMSNELDQFPKKKNSYQRPSERANDQNLNSKSFIWFENRRSKYKPAVVS